MKKSLYITPMRGGIGNWSACLIDELDKLVDIQIVTFRKKRQTDDKESFTKIKEKNILKFIKPSRVKHLIEYNNKNSLNSIKKLTEDYKPDVVHLIMWAGPQILWFVKDYCKYLKKKNIPIVMTIHDVYPHASKNKKEQEMYLNTWKYADKIVLLTTDELTKLKKHNFKVPTEIIPHGVYHFQNENLVNKKQARNIISKKLGKKINIKTNIVLFLGYVRDYKGLMNLIKIAPSILKKHPDTLFIAAGTIELAENPEKYPEKIKQLGIQDKFLLYSHFIDNERLFESFYKSCDVNVMPYIGVSASGALFTGIGMKRPVIISKIGTFIAELQKKGLIYTVKPGNLKSLEKEIINVLQNKKKAQARAEKAYNVTKIDYGWGKIAKKYQKIYNSL